MKLKFDILKEMVEEEYDYFANLETYSEDYEFKGPRTQDSTKKESDINDILDRRDIRLDDLEPRVKNYLLRQLDTVMVAATSGDLARANRRKFRTTIAVLLSEFEKRIEARQARMRAQA